MSEHLSHGINANEMVAEAEGIKVVGVMSRNRPESYVTHIANMY